MEWKDIVDAQNLLQSDDSELTVNPDNIFWGYSAEYASKRFPERQLASDIMVYGPPFLLVIATVGNILSAIVLWRLMRKVLSTCLYVFVAMPVDLVALYIRCGNDWLVHLAAVDIRHIAMFSSKSMCKIYPFVEDVSLHFSVWLMVAMAVETTIVTMRPKSLLKTCTVDRARAVVMLLTVLMVCVSAHCFWTYALIKIERSSYEREVCATIRQGNQKDGDQFRSYAWPVIGILVSCLLPFIIIFACVVLTIVRRLRKRDQVKQLENTWKAYSVDACTARQCQIAFIVLSIAHLVLFFPQLVYDIFYFFAHPVLMGMSQFTISLDAKLELGSAISAIFIYIALSCKFLVFIAVSKRFRMDFANVVMCRLCREVPRRIERPLTREPLLNNAYSAPPGEHKGNCLVRTEYAMTSV